MPGIERIRADVIDTLDAQTFAGLGCVEHGLVVMRGAKSWGAHERGSITLPLASGSFELPLAYDEREAPYAVDLDGDEQPDLLLSLTDEDDYLACAWARVEAGSPLVGVGVDLSAGSHFAPRPTTSKRRDLSLLLFTEDERALLPALGDDDLLAKAALFAAKEAAFKATAAPLRTWYRSHDEQLLYEVRHFVMTEPGIERGVGRNQAAQRAMDRMGIRQVIVRHAPVCGMSLVTAVALAST